MIYVRWFIRFLLVILFCHIIGRILSPFACLFIVRRPRTDVVKRYDKKVVTLDRDYLVEWLTWFDTDDNATDEYWYGWYDESYPKTQESQDYYDSHRTFRWWCRVKWLQRNSCYTFNRKFFGLPKSSPYAWQYKADIPLLFGYYNSMNIGYKAHKNFDTLMLAGRIIGLRRYK